MALTSKDFSLQPDVVDVWLLPVGEPRPDAAFEFFLPHMPELEVHRYRRFVFQTKRNEYLLGKLLTRYVLSRYLGCTPASFRFQEGPRGKPFLPDPAPLTFNMSHTKGLLALAVSPGNTLGVDVERLEVRDGDIARRFFSAVEADHFEASPVSAQTEVFGRYWTLKEAYIKAHGDGLAVPLDSFHFRLDPPILIHFRDRQDDPTLWHFVSQLPTAYHALGVAVKSPRPVEIRIHTLELPDLVAAARAL